MVYIDCIKEGWGDIPDVFRADLTRLKVLGTEGGLWLDCDLINFSNLKPSYYVWIT
jgi:mannosyltransferase OCH1-like enzyme